jgi:hypothetical protein
MSARGLATGGRTHSWSAKAFTRITSERIAFTVMQVWPSDAVVDSTVSCLNASSWLCRAGPTKFGQLIS